MEREIEIDAPASVVWTAITDAVELSRWFPLEARVTPGLGGSVWMRWDAEAPDTSTITAWDPQRHLRIEDVAGTWSGIATDYYLRPSSSGEATILRVVSSGFGDGDAWDDTVGAFGRGWDFELRGLRHYLTRHRGTPRVVLSALVSYSTSDDVAWQSVMRWLGFADPVLTEGQRFATTMQTGDSLSGSVQHAGPM
ncbi:MAG: SRPBCC domain-containing protein, partial [Solirubrobacteraceae bacterium]